MILQVNKADTMCWLVYRFSIWVTLGPEKVIEADTLC